MWRGSGPGPVGGQPGSSLAPDCAKPDHPIPLKQDARVQPLTTGWKHSPGVLLGRPRGASCLLLQEAHWTAPEAPGALCGVGRPPFVPATVLAASLPGSDFQLCKGGEVCQEAKWEAFPSRQHAVDRGIPGGNSSTFFSRAWLHIRCTEAQLIILVGRGEQRWEAKGAEADCFAGFLQGWAQVQGCTGAASSPVGIGSPHCSHLVLEVAEWLKKCRSEAPPWNLLLFVF